MTSLSRVGAHLSSSVSLLKITPDSIFYPRGRHTTVLFSSEHRINFSSRSLVDLCSRVSSGPARAGVGLSTRPAVASRWAPHSPGGWGQTPTDESWLHEETHRWGHPAQRVRDAPPQLILLSLSPWVSQARLLDSVTLSFFVRNNNRLNNSLPRFAILRVRQALNAVSVSKFSVILAVINCPSS